MYSVKNEKVRNQLREYTKQIVVSTYNRPGDRVNVTRMIELYRF